MLLNITAVFLLGGAILIAVIFAHAGFSKLTPDNRVYYQTVIADYGLTPQSWSSHLVLFIGSIEILIALLTILSLTQTLGLMLASGLLTVYTLVFLKQLYQGKADMDCGCAGPSAGVKIGFGLVLRNIALILVCVVAIINFPVITTDSYLLALPLAIALILIYSSIEQLVTNKQKIQAIRNSKF